MGAEAAPWLGLRMPLGEKIKKVEIKWFVAEFNDIAALVRQNGDAQQLVFKDDGLQAVQLPAVRDAAAVIAWESKSHSFVCRIRKYVETTEFVVRR